LNVGAISALAPNLQSVADLLGTDVPTVRTVLNSWGPGHFDAELFMDGKAFRPDGKSASTLIPPAFGRRRESSYLDRLGFRHLLECFRGQPRNAWQRHVLRSAFE